MPLIRTVTIAGVGLIGGSFALAIRKAGFDGEILGVSSPRTIEQAIARGVIDRGVSLEEGAALGDLIYLAQPICRIIEHIPEIGKFRKSTSLVTDVGSTKKEIMAAAAEYLPAGAFLGGHPMAGKESRGVEAAEADLFEGRSYLITPSDINQLNSEIAIEFIDIVKSSLLSRLLILGAETHDRVLAFTSHLAQMASTALSATVLAKISESGHLATAGPGLTDMSRLALSSYDVWKDIIATNSPAIQDALSSYIDTLQSLRRTLGGAETQQLFEKGSNLARSIREQLP